MSIIACAVDGCERRRECKDWCAKHYARFKRHGDPTATVSRPRSSAGTRSTCEVGGCESVVKGQGYCLKHYQRFKKTGDPLRNPSGREFRSYKDGESCEAGACTSPPKKRGLCGKHYQRLMSHGDIEVVLHREGCLVEGCKGKHFGRGYCAKHHYRVTATGNPEAVPSGRIPPGTYDGCIVEGCTRRMRGGRGMCGVHAGNFRATGNPLQTPGPRVKSRPCEQCGTMMDLTAVSKGRRRATSARRVCRDCRRDSNIQRFIPDLVERDGSACNICSVDVDLTLSWPHPRSKSVDHVIPWSRGGADDISNYALTHLHCNISKHNRVEALDAVT